MQGERKQKKLDEKFEEVGGELKVGDKVKMKNNRTIGIVKELRGKKAILQVGVIPITVETKDLVVVVDKTQSEQ
jgi:DNA mismatch repair protein MutS2